MNQLVLPFAEVPAPEPAKTPTPNNATTTRAAAAVAIRPEVHGLRLKVWNYIKGQGIAGATDKEIRAGLAMGGSTERPRRKELEAMGVIRDSGQVRLTASGRSAVVWIDCKTADTNT